MDIASLVLSPLFVGEEKIEFIEKSVPEPGPGQLLIRSRANALCASDMFAYRDASPTTPGHETSGVVAAAGEGTSIPVGTLGVIFLMDFCGQCRSCLLGITNQCLAKRADYGFSHDGGYGPYMLVNENVFFVIDSDTSPAEATLLLDVMGTGGHAIKRGRLMHPDVQSLLVTGSGPIGLGILAMAKLIFGFDFPVFITDMSSYRLALAEKLGAMPINIENESIQEAFARHDFKKCDLAIDSSGMTVARREAMDMLDKRGVMVCVGHGQELQLDVSSDLIAPEHAVIGSEYFCYDELEQNMEFMRHNKDYLGQIVTHRYPVAEIQEAFYKFCGRE
ncbi:MAG: alcohol dehydrogenase catalytic domain-containing protein, partial [Planctomycetes bacterium]|nr:alcohol dehydrogenase catalytic domain-containing protein [Planctomycetota bacterium]